ncbi:unnamed protein product [Closterium sp. Yama58-4]|nr:unnamed protein product [Closterium sp. Yama58-4]
MTAGFAAIGQVLGMSREELISAGENMLQKPACAVQGAGVSLDSKFASAVGAYPCFPAHLPIPGTVPHWLLSRQQGAAVSLVQPSYPVYGIAQSGAGAHPGFTAVPKQEPLAGGEDSDEDGEGETEPGTKPTKYTGVYVEADTGKFGVKVVAKDKDGKKVTKRVGAYTTIEEAAYCYAAAAHVLRPGMGTRNSVALTPADRAALKGCTPEVLKVLVDARMWWRWRVWREAYEGVMRKAARAKKNATPAKRGRPRKESGAQGGGTAGEGEGEKAGSEDTEIVAIEPTNSRALGRLRSADAKSTDDKTDEAGRGRQQDETTGGETSDASPGRVGKQAAESDSPDSRSKSDVDPRLALRNRGEDVDGGDQARIESDVNAFEEEDDEDVGDAMRAMFETNTNRENTDAPTNGEEVRVSAGVFRSLLKSQDESAKKVARLETLLLEALAKSDGGSRRRKAERQREPGQGCMNPKRQRRGEAVAERLCELVRVQLFLKKPAAAMTFYPSSDDKTYGVCAVLDRLPHSFACLALAADKSRRADLNKTLSEWKTRAAARVRDIALPKLGFFRDERDEASPWARDNARTLEQIRERIGFGADESDDLVLSNWANDRDGMPFASAAFAACAKAAFIPKKAALPLTLKVYHLAWLEHVVSDSIMYWEQRMGRLSNSAGGNGHVVNRLKVLVKGSVSQAIRHFNPEYDEEKEEWIWGRHGLRLSACGLESMKPNAGASGGDAAGNDVQSVSVGGDHVTSGAKPQRGPTATLVVAGVVHQPCELREGVTHSTMAGVEDTWDKQVVRWRVVINQFLNKDAADSGATSRIDKQAAMARRRDTGFGSYGPNVTSSFYSAFEKHPLVGKSVLIIGSQWPWVEAICLGFDAHAITTVDFNRPIASHPKLRQLVVSELEGSSETWDVAVSFSSLEHDGLGRYGDPINPNGDLERMKKGAVVEGYGLLRCKVGCSGARWALVDVGWGGTMWAGAKRWAVSKVGCGGARCAAVDQGGSGARWGPAAQNEPPVCCRKEDQGAAYPGGLLFLGVPTGNDTLVFNAHRIYGPIRMPLLISGFHLLDVFGIDSLEKLYSENINADIVQPLLVLRRD